jgi:transposase
LDAGLCGAGASGSFDLTVVNPHHAKALRKRKTDIKDAEWLAYLVRHDLVNKSFVPAKPFRDLRDLTRYRRTLVEAQASERRRLIKLLEAADISRGSSATSSGSPAAPFCAP